MDIRDNTKTFKIKTCIESEEQRIEGEWFFKV